ncbi:hypothetical protein DW322_08835 [Rhodococcus rhodnii]|uniref:DUF3168 domain-containing protein n=2 Tax=Rhodococcus rhodnii TaxID=38312 RepID=R7WRK0_9NOCA|nr:hypothetical protein [Rhodococcus rhodnii]EOM77905.1 hypothetical protein Rrhod_0714 [Rhodococcus rhodnii LMG 5362]TXG90310.1 hypothetical protein DW322_08835 [Rhodococcus rhodnii]
MSAPLFVPKSATKVAIALVRDGLPGGHHDVLVTDAVPDERPSRLVRLSRIAGGGFTAHGATDTARFLVEVWGDDVDATEDLANVVRAVLRASRSRWAGGAFVRKWNEDTGPYPFPDESGQERWQMTGELLIKVG